MAWDHNCEMQEDSSCEMEIFLAADARVSQPMWEVCPAPAGKDAASEVKEVWEIRDAASNNDEGVSHARKGEYPASIQNSQLFNSALECQHCVRDLGNLLVPFLVSSPPSQWIPNWWFHCFSLSLGWLVH